MSLRSDCLIFFQDIVYKRKNELVLHLAENEFTIGLLHVEEHLDWYWVTIRRTGSWREVAAARSLAEGPRLLSTIFVFVFSSPHPLIQKNHMTAQHSGRDLF